MLYRTDTPYRHYEVIGIVSAGVGECGDSELPGIYVRVEHPEIFNFIQSVIGKKEYEEGKLYIGIAGFYEFIAKPVDLYGVLVCVCVSTQMTI